MGADQLGPQKPLAPSRRAPSISQSLAVVAAGRVRVGNGGSGLASAPRQVPLCARATALVQSVSVHVMLGELRPWPRSAPQALPIRCKLPLYRREGRGKGKQGMILGLGRMLLVMLVLLTVVYVSLFLYLRAAPACRLEEELGDGGPSRRPRRLDRRAASPPRRGAFAHGWSLWFTSCPWRG